MDQSAPSEAAAGHGTAAAKGSSRQGPVAGSASPPASESVAAAAAASAEIAAVPNRAPLRPAEPAAALAAPEAPAATERDATPVAVRRKDEQVVLAVHPTAPFEAVRDGLRKLFARPGSEDPLPGDAAFFDAARAAARLGRLPDRTARLDLDTRGIDLFDLRRLVHLLKDDHQVTVTGIYCTSAALHRYVEQELKLRVVVREQDDLDLDADEGGDEPTEATRIEGASVEPEQAPVPPAPTAEEPVSAPLAAVSAMDVASGKDGAESGRRVMLVDKTLRSGANIRFPGDVIVFGDVNAGAHIEAAGNILVLGSLRGLAHAGAPSDEASVILAFELRPTQLRIGRKIGFPLKRDEREGSGGFAALLHLDRSAARPPTNEIAFVRDGQILIEDYRGRLPV